MTKTEFRAFSICYMCCTQSLQPPKEAVVYIRSKNAHACKESTNLTTVQLHTYMNFTHHQTYSAWAPAMPTTETTFKSSYTFSQYRFVFTVVSLKHVHTHTHTHTCTSWILRSKTEIIYYLYHNPPKTPVTPPNIDLHIPTLCTVSKKSLTPQKSPAN